MDSNCKKQTLSNGLTLLTIPMRSVGSVTVLSMVRVGSRYETERIRGLTHFLMSRGNFTEPQVSAILIGLEVIICIVSFLIIGYI